MIFDLRLWLRWLKLEAIPTAQGLFASFFQNGGWNVFLITQVPPYIELDYYGDYENCVYGPILFLWNNHLIFMCMFADSQISKVTSISPPSIRSQRKNVLNVSSEYLSGNESCFLDLCILKRKANTDDHTFLRLEPWLVGKYLLVPKRSQLL